MKTVVEARGQAAAPEPYESFLKAAMLFTLTGGCLLGAVLILNMGLTRAIASNYHALVEAHGHLQLFGWVGLFIMGVATHVLPRFKEGKLYKPPLARRALWLTALGVGARFLAGIFDPSLDAGKSVIRVLLPVSGVLELAGVATFLHVIRMTLRQAKSKQRKLFELFVYSGLTWLFVVTVAGFVTGLDMARKGTNLTSGPLHATGVELVVYGFILMVIFGVSLRTLPGFLGLHPPRQGAVMASLVGLNATVLVRALAEGASPSHAGGGFIQAVAGAAAVVQALSVLVFIYGLNIFRKPEIDMSDLDMDRSYERFIRVGYVWLLAAALASGGFGFYRLFTGEAVPHPLVGAYRHALTVGFINMLIFGFASRIIPVFTGVDIHSARITQAVFVLVNLGNVLRVVLQPLAGFTGNPVLSAGMGISGSIEVLGIALFSYNILRTISSSRKQPVLVGGLGQEAR